MALGTTQRWFDGFASKSSKILGSSWVFFGVCLSTIIWLGYGPWTHYSDTWQLVCNTTSTIATTFVVVLTLNSQNRDTALIKALLQEIAEDLPQVNDRRATRRAGVET
jgi:low affinity Fe/Cu permease